VGINPEGAFFLRSLGGLTILVGKHWVGKFRR